MNEKREKRSQKIKGSEPFFVLAVRSGGSIYILELSIDGCSNPERLPNVRYPAGRASLLMKRIRQFNGTRPDWPVDIHPAKKNVISDGSQNVRSGVPHAGSMTDFKCCQQPTAGGRINEISTSTAPLRRSLS